MAPPFEITDKIVNLISEVSQILGRLDSISKSIPQPKLRKKNRIRTIKSTLAIEGNTFTEEQITGILDNKKVLGSKKEIIEVKNAINLYESIDLFSSFSVKSFHKAHFILMKDLIINEGKFRTKNVGIMRGKIVKHVAPKPIMVPELIAKLFQWIKATKEIHYLIKSCVVHYEIEFIHPFEDGNGRMGRFWQTLILSEHNKIFRYLPIESIIEKKQNKYYETLEMSDKLGSSTPFIEFMLQIILDTLKEFDAETKGIIITPEDRLNKANEYFENHLFSRKDYMEYFKSVSTATASRDLAKGIELKKLKKIGEKNQAKYKFNKT
jgi:Fic family protein